MEHPHFFVDEMVRGIFHSFKHVHEFEAEGNSTLMLDTFTYEAPLGILGRFVDKMLLERYMRNLLVERNVYLKRTAEATFLASV